MTEVLEPNEFLDRVSARQHRFLTDDRSVGRTFEQLDLDFPAFKVFLDRSDWMAMCDDFIKVYLQHNGGIPSFETMVAYFFENGFMHGYTHALEDHAPGRMT